MKREWNFEFGAGHAASVVELAEGDDLPSALAAAGVEASRPVVVVVGGATGMTDDTRRRARFALRGALVPVCEEVGATVVDGGTAAGVMQALGDARATVKAKFPLIGVAPVRKVRLPGTAEADDGRADLERDHSHFFLVPGANWGDESPWIVRIARTLAGDSPYVGLVLGGGDITAIDARLLADGGARMVAVSGTGGVADDLAAARRAGSSSGSPVEVVDWQATDALRTVLRRALANPV